MRPMHTRLRHIRSKDLILLEEYLANVGFRVQILSINYDSKQWVVHYLPPMDIGIDLPSRDLDE